MFRNFRLGQFSAVASLAVMSAVSVAPRAAQAAAYSYNTTQKTINAGILIMQDPAGATNPQGLLGNTDPYPFYILSQRSDVKPGGGRSSTPWRPRL